MGILTAIRPLPLDHDDDHHPQDPSTHSGFGPASMMFVSSSKRLVESSVTTSLFHRSVGVQSGAAIGIEGWTGPGSIVIPSSATLCDFVRRPQNKYRSFSSSKWGRGTGVGGNSSGESDNDNDNNDDDGGGSFGITANYHPLRWNQFPDGSRFWRPVANTGRKQRPIFVAATRQHVGKTTTSLAIMSGLQKRYEKVGFLKPVGQQHVPVTSQKRNETIRVDKDCVLVRIYVRDE